MSFSSEVSIKEETLNQESLEAYLDYYKQLIKYFSSQADALGMLAFCYSLLDDQSKAIALYKQAIDLDPSFFGFLIIWERFILNRKNRIHQK